MYPTTGVGEVGCGGVLAALERHRGTAQRDADVLTLAHVGARVQAGDGAEGGERAGADVVQRHRLDHRVVGTALRHHDPAPGLEQRVEAGGVGEGTLPPPLDVGVHEPRIAGAEAVEVEAQVARHLARHVLDQRVGPVHERGECLAASCVLEVETDLVLVAVQRRVRRRGHGAELLTPGRVDLHHARPEVLQHQAPERTGEELGGVDDEHPVERKH